MPIIKRWKQIILSGRFWKKALRQKERYGKIEQLFPNHRIAFEMTMRAIRYKQYGTFIVDWRPESPSRWICAFKNHKGILVAVPIIERYDYYIIPTVFFCDDTKWMKNTYKKIKCISY